MGWVRIDDQAPRHHKLLRAGPDAAWLWVCSLAHCQSQLTDGFVSNAVLPMIGIAGVAKARRLANTLVEVGLFDIVDGGFQIHDYLDWNDSAAQVRADKEWDKFRKALYADHELVEAIKKRDDNCCRYCGVRVNWADRRGARGGQFDHVIPRGPNTLDNLVVACRNCNCGKSGRTPQAARLQLRPVPNRNGTSSSLSTNPIQSNPIQSVNKKTTHGRRQKEPPDRRVFEFIGWFVEEFRERRHGAEYMVNGGKDGALVKQMLATTDLERLKVYAQIMLSDKCEDPFICESDRGIGILKVKFNWLSDRYAAWKAKQPQAS